MEYRSLPDLRNLATLKAVVEQGGVAEAGRVLNIGQPAVTKRLRALDACYGLVTACNSCSVKDVGWS